MGGCGGDLIMLRPEIGRLGTDQVSLSKRCPKCKWKAEKDDNFCPECETRI